MKKYLIQFPVCFLLFSLGVFSQVQVVPDASPNLPPPPPGILPNLPVELPSSTNSSANAAEEQAAQDSVEQFESPAFSPLSDPEELLLIDGLDEEFQVLKIRDQDTNMILDMIQLITGRYILRPQNLPAVKITFDSMAVLTKRETLLAVESLLAMNGVAITKIDDKFYKAVPAQGANVHVPIWLDAPASTLRPSQRIYMKLFRLKYAPALEVREQLNAFATPNVSSLIAFEKSNSILITDSLLNLQRIEDLLNEIDKPVTKEDLGMKWEVWQTQHASANDLENKLKALIEGSFKPFLGGTTQVDADERTGKLLIVTREENWSTIEYILDAYDAPIKKSTTNKHFILQHAESKEIKTILDDVIKAQQSVKQKIQGRKTGATAQNTSNNQTQTPPANTSNDSNNGESKQAHEFSDYVTISADERSNAILVYGTKDDIEEIGRMISDLDQPLPLARIDTIFLMVDLSDTSSSGIDALFKDLRYDEAKREFFEYEVRDPVTGLPTGDTEQREEFTPASLDGTFQIPGINSPVKFNLSNWQINGIEWSTIFTQATTRNDVRIFSSPSLMVSHNSEKVHIMIEDERSIVRPYYYDPYRRGTTQPGSANQETEPGSDMDMLSAKTSLEISKPKIGLNVYERDKNGSFVLDNFGQRILKKKGSIYMEVEIKAEKFDETNVNIYEGQELPAKKNREAKTFLTLKDGEIVALGGLQEAQYDSTTAKYNFLSDIPYFGGKFFTPKSTKYTPTELLIFIKPTIIDPDDDNIDIVVKKIEENSNKINQDVKKRARPNYKPEFKFLDGESFDLRNMKPYEDKNYKQDNKSPIPVLF